MYYNNMWEFNGVAFTEDMIEDYIGFVYILEHRDTGLKYIGKKNFYSHAKSRITGKKTKTISLWKNYYGSSSKTKALVKEYGAESFVRTILHLCKSKREMSYLEEKEQFSQDVLRNDDYLNDNIGLRHYRTKL